MNPVLVIIDKCYNFGGLTKWIISQSLKVYLVQEVGAGGFCAHCNSRPQTEENIKIFNMWLLRLLQAQLQSTDGRER